MLEKTLRDELNYLGDEEGEKVESVALNFVNQEVTEEENYTVNYSSVGIVHPVGNKEDIGETKTNDVSQIKRNLSEDNEKIKQCPDSLSACLSVCKPIKKIRERAYTLCKRECRKRCKEEEIKKKRR